MDYVTQTDNFRSDNKKIKIGMVKFTIMHCNVPMMLHKSVADPGLWSGGGPRKLFCEFADGAKRSRANEVSFRRPGSRAHLRALEALGFFIAKYAFSYFSWYLFVLFLK